MNVAMINSYAKENKIGEAEKVIYESVVLHKGWEADNAACLVRMKDGKHRIFSTNHGKVFEMTDKDLNQIVKEAENFYKDIVSLRDLAQEHGAMKRKASKG